MDFRSIPRALGRWGKRALRWVAPSILSGIFLWLAFPPGNAWPLAWVGLVPLILGLERSGLLGGFGRGWVAGALFQFLAGCLSGPFHKFVSGLYLPESVMQVLFCEVPVERLRG